MARREIAALQVVEPRALTLFFEESDETFHAAKATDVAVANRSVQPAPNWIRYPLLRPALTAPNSPVAPGRTPSETPWRVGGLGSALHLLCNPKDT
jgi:hypothetical protein